MSRIGICLGIALVSLPLGGSAQQFVDTTATAFGDDNAKEYTHALALGDIDGDGDLDLAVANANALAEPTAEATVHQSRLYLNDGKGVFSDVTDARLPVDPGWYRDVAFADLDGDDDLDLVLVGGFGFEPKIFINGGDGHYLDKTKEQAPSFTGWWGGSVTIGDIEMDGDLDLYFTNSGTKTFAPPGGQDRLWLNDGKGKFFDASDALLPKLITRASVAAAFSDVDDDGDLDVFVVNRDIKSNLLLNDGGGRFSDGSFLLPKDGKLTAECELADINGDGRVDIFLVNGSTTSIPRELLLLNSSGGASEGFVNATDLLLGGPGANDNADDGAVELLDVDMDGDPDVLIGSITPGKERVLINDGNGIMTGDTSLIGSAADATLDLAVGDLDGDNRPDLVTAQGEQGNFENRVYLNEGPADDQPPVVGNVHAAGLTGAYLGPVPIVARVTDAYTTDTGPRLVSVKLNGTKMRWAGGSLFRGEIASGLIKEPFTVVVSATDAGGATTESEPVTLGPRHPLDVFPDGVADDNDLSIMIDHLLDKGGLGSAADLNGDGVVSLSDAQLLASGLGGAPVLTRVFGTTSGSFLLVGANFGGTVTVTVPGATASVLDAGPISALVDLDGAPTGAFRVGSSGQESNAQEVNQ